VITENTWRGNSLNHFHPLPPSLIYPANLSDVTSWGQEIGDSRRSEFCNQIYDRNIQHLKSLYRKIETVSEDTADTIKEKMDVEQEG
jgi:hypothetical protein